MNKSFTFAPLRRQRKQPKGTLGYGHGSVAPKREDKYEVVSPSPAVDTTPTATYGYLFLDRKGNNEEAFMKTEQMVGEIYPDTPYQLYDHDLVPDFKCLR